MAIRLLAGGTLLLFDCEGGDRRDDPISAGLQALTSMCSWSVFILNVDKCLDNRALDLLSGLSSLSNFVAQTLPEPYTSCGVPVSTFFLLRNKQGQLTIDRRPVSAQEYLAHSLAPKGDMRDEVRGVLRGLKNLQLVDLPHPSGGFPDRPPTREAFGQPFNHLVDLITQRLTHALTIAGVPVSDPEHLSQYLTALCNGTRNRPVSVQPLAHNLHKEEGSAPAPL